MFDGIPRLLSSSLITGHYTTSVEPGVPKVSVMHKINHKSPPYCTSKRLESRYGIVFYATSSLYKFTTDLILLRPLLIFRLVRKISKRDYLLRHVNPPVWNNSASNGQILMKFGI